MKSKKLIETNALFSFLVAILLIFFSCKKETQSPSDSISMTATVTALTSYSFSGLSISSSVNITSNYFLITSLDKNSNSIQLWVNNVSPVIGTTYTLSNGGSSGLSPGTATATYNSDYETDATHKGSIKFTKFDLNAHKISGTFNFTAIDPLNSIVTVSNGTFTDMSWP